MSDALETTYNLQRRIKQLKETLAETQKALLARMATDQPKTPAEVSAWLGIETMPSVRWTLDSDALDLGRLECDAKDAIHRPEEVLANGATYKTMFNPHTVLAVIADNRKAWARCAEEEIKRWNAETDVLVLMDRIKELEKKVRWRCDKYPACSCEAMECCVQKD